MDLIEAKNALSERLLTGGAESGVVGRMPAVSVVSAAAAAGKNVHAVGIGNKIVGGEITEEPCVRLYVVQKLAKSIMANDDILPESIDGIPTDIIESPPAFLTVDAACSAMRREQNRPATAGVSAAHFQVTAGTISCFCRSTAPGDPEGIYVLSNNHVFANVNQGQVGDDLFQPGRADGGTANDRFAVLHRYVEIEIGANASNRVDAAIGAVLPEVEVDTQICSIGNFGGVRLPQPNMKVCKHGRTTGYTEGVVFDLSVDQLIGLDPINGHVVARFRNQLRINVSSPFSAFALAGDSGSLVVDQSTREVIGLYNAGPNGGSYGLANPIQDVLTELEIDLLT